MVTPEPKGQERPFAVRRAASASIRTAIRIRPGNPLPIRCSGSLRITPKPHTTRSESTAIPNPRSSSTIRGRCPAAHAEPGLAVGIHAWLMYSTADNLSEFVPSNYNPATAMKYDSSGNLIPGSGTIDNGLGRVANGVNHFPSVPGAELGRPDGDHANSFLAGAPRGMYPSQQTWQPRAGFAFAADQSTVFRGGFGINYDRIQGNPTFYTLNNPPYVGSVQYTNASLANIAAGTSVLSPWGHHSDDRPEPEDPLLDAVQFWHPARTAERDDRGRDLRGYAQPSPAGRTRSQPAGLGRGEQRNQQHQPEHHPALSGLLDDPDYFADPDPEQAITRCKRTSRAAKRGSRLPRHTRFPKTSARPRATR